MISLDIIKNRENDMDKRMKEVKALIQEKQELSVQIQKEILTLQEEFLILDGAKAAYNEIAYICETLEKEPEVCEEAACTAE